MSIENELKVLPNEAINKEELVKILEENKYKADGKFKVKEQEDTYFDDQNGTLSKNGCSFRIRRVGGKAIVTCKIPRESDTGYKQREEMEEEIPEQYISEDATIILEDAIRVLKDRYPNIILPDNLEFIIKVCNERNKINIKSEDGTIIELAFDNLHTENKEGLSFEMKDEIECEVLSGNPDNLKEIYEIIKDNYEVQTNELSKYSRAVKEMNEQKDNMSLDEMATCAILSDILKSNEFKQLKYKGQMLYDYRKEIPYNLNLDRFKDAQYLINKISEVKRTKNYQPNKIKTLEDMFLCFFSDMSYKDIEYRLANFLNDNYYKNDTPITNRMLHSQQVMLITGLISRSNEIPAKDKNLLLCMTSALFHDIGHVPGAHPTEEVLCTLDGFFSHEINGRNVIDKILSQDEKSILEEINKYYTSIGKECDHKKVLDYFDDTKLQMKKSIEAHSRTNSEKRGEGTVVQLPREADKICYCTSDIADIIKLLSDKETENKVKFFNDEWKTKIAKKFGKGYEKETIIRQKIDDIEKQIRTSSFGSMVTNIANTVSANINDGKIYYDVEQDTWDILDSMIKYVKELRNKGVINNKRKELKLSATYFIVKKFNEDLKKCGGNVEKAWNDTIDIITNSNDLDILNSINELKVLFENKQEKFDSAFLEGGILDISKIIGLDNSDRQLKIQPQGKFQMSDLLPSLGTKYDTPPIEEIRDTYFNSGEKGVSICLREYVNENRRLIIVKKNRNKSGVTQVERERYSTESYEDCDLEGLINKFNLEHKDITINVPQGKPKCIIETTRNSAENAEGIVIRKDDSVIVNGGTQIKMPETIEIECPHRDLLKKVKQQLYEFLDSKGIEMYKIVTKETKEEQAMKLLGQKGINE